MNKIKKIFVSLGAFLIASVLKIGGVICNAISIDQIGTLSPQPEYGIAEPTVGEKIFSIGKAYILIICFIIGLIVILNKKMSKKAKAILLTALVAIGIIIFAIMKYFSENY